MTDNHLQLNDFLTRITNIIEDNISNDKFGVSELADHIGMSRSNLLRKIKKLTNLSASKFISLVRLRNAMELLKEGDFTVSEVSYRVGFNSSSYFVKCFHDHYGFPPGEVGKGKTIIENVPEPGKQKPVPRTLIISISAILVVLTVVLLIINPFKREVIDSDKSIAVLPFKNDSNDSTNLYLINGLMESLLNNLQSIEDLRVISRTSVEKYRYAPMIIPEIAKELNVKFFVEGSGQKIGDEILLNIQLIEAVTDKHLWAQQYRRESGDIFQLQIDIARDITEQIKAIITPEEEARLEKKPTENLIAYDYFLKGLDLLNNPTQENLDTALVYFNMAIEEDKEFARAYAAIAISYYLMDKDLAVKSHSDLVNTYADKALLYDDQLAQSLIAKALYYMSNREYKLAISYFEKALEYNPNSDIVYVFLVDLYANYFPDTEKYLEYALKGLRINMAVYDSLTQSYSYLHISNSFIQSGFIDEAEKYIYRSLDYYPENIYSLYVLPYILFSKTGDLEETRDRLAEVFQKDTTRLDVMQELAKICYYQRDYKMAYHYYSRFIEVKEYLQLNIYPGEDAKIALVFAEVGRQEESDELFRKYKEYADNDLSLYKNMSLAAYYSIMGNSDEALKHMRLFSKEDNYHYWTLLFLKIDPLMDNIKDSPEFEEIFEDIEKRFWDYHKRIRTTLEDEGLI